LGILIQAICRFTALRARRLSMTMRRRKRHRPQEVVTKMRDADAMFNIGRDLAGVLQASDIQMLKHF